MSRSATSFQCRFFPVRALSVLVPGGLLTMILAYGANAAAGDMAVSDSAQLAFPTEPGKVYQLLASTDLQSWPEAGEPVFGTGGMMELWAPGQASAAGHQFFRLRSESEPAGGLAPWQMPTAPLVLNEGQRSVKYSFAANAAGTWTSGEVTRAFTWSWLRTGLDEGRMTVTWADGSHEELKMDFAAPLLGQFVRDEWQEGLLIRTVAGTFGPLPGDGTALVPSDLAGRKIALADGATSSVLALEGTNSGTRTLDGQSRPVSYSWLVTGGSVVTLTANISPTHGEEYRLNFSAPRTGTFVRRTFTEGVFRDEDSGVFTLSEAAH